MGNESTSEQLDRLEAVASRANAELRGMKSRLRKKGSSPELKAQAYALRDELEGCLRELRAGSGE